MTDPNTAPSEIDSPDIVAEQPATQAPEGQSPDPVQEPAAEITPEERIKKLEKALERNKRDKARARAELYEERRQRELARDKPAEPSPQAPVKIKSEDFETIEDYVEALADKKAKDAARDTWEQSRKETTAKEQAAQAERQHRDFLQKVEEVREKLPDFDDVMQEVSDDYVAPHVEALIKKFGPESAYWIVKEDALEELNSLDVYDATIRMKELSSRTQAKPVTRTPAPMTAIKGRAAPEPTVLNMKSGDEVRKWLKS